MTGKIIKTEEKKKFKPFKIELNIQTENEARLLYLIFHTAMLKSSIKEYGNYDEGFCDWDKTEECFQANFLRTEIRKMINL